MKLRILITAFLGFCTFSIAQQLNTEISQTGQAPYLLGKINKTGLEGPNYSSWFNKNYEDYQTDTKSINKLVTTLKDYEILMFMGTWCRDSKREVPRFYKVLDATDFPKAQLTTIAVGRTADMYKQSPQHEEAGLNIHRVPTFIIYKNGKEINRIVEEPVESLEKDLLKIISSNSYESNYAIVTAVDNKLKKGIRQLKKSEQKIIKTYQDKVSSIYELNTYARVLSYSGKSEEALAVLELNTKLFPENANTYVNLSNNLMQLSREQEARLALEKAAELAPQDQKIQDRLEQLKSK